MSETVFNRYDIRGDWPEEIDEDFSRRLGRAVGTYAQREGRGRVIMGHDTREHSEDAADAFADGVGTTGAALVRVGEGTTDRVAMAANHYGGIGAMVTASHHDWSRTGFKLLYEQGHGFNNEDLERIKDLFRQQDFEDGHAHVLGERWEFTEEYMDTLLEYVESFAIPDGTVVLDCCNGGASRLAPELFEELGFDVVTVNDDTTGGGIDPEPGEDNRRDVKERMEDEDADLAVGFDPDGDRVYAIHPEMGWIGGNELFYLLGRITEAGTIAASVDTSGLIEELDADIEYSRVGDVFVSGLGVEIGADLLGEPNGHYAVTEVCWYNSGILAGMLLAAHHDELGSMLSDVPSYFTERRVLRLEEGEKDGAMQTAIKRAAKNYDVLSTVDGVKFTDGEVTALVRPSGTSPKIRLIVNGTDEKTVRDRADGLYEELFD